MFRIPRLCLSLAILLSFAGLTQAQDKAPDPVPAKTPDPVPAKTPDPVPAKTPLPVAAKPLPEPDPKAVAVTVNGTPILERAIYRAVRLAPPEEQAKARGQILNFLIDNALVDQYLDQLKVTIEPKEIDAAIDEMKEEIKKANGKFEDVMKNLLLTEAELREQLGAELRWRKFLGKYATDAVLSDFFTKNKAFFDGSQVRARHILIPATRDDAKAIEAAATRIAIIKKQIEERTAQELAKGQTPADAIEKEKAQNKALEIAFAEVAGKESSCPSKGDGGEVGWFARSGKMVEPFARVAFTLKPYQLSDAVVSDFGCHLIMVTETRAGREVRFEDMKEVAKDVYGDRMREAIVGRARSAAKIESGTGATK
jgi:parvulin-like peptidyl-prolyl isomerase